MRALLALWVIVASFAPAEAQPSDPPKTQAPPAETTPAAFAKTTHFLIDASGSMEKRQTKLDALLVAKRKEIQQAGLPPAIETRFGGENGGMCGTPVEVGKSDIGVFSKVNDNTPLGTALEAALQAVGNGPADIFIFTDEEQTPGCGPDICTVAERYLPKDGIFVQSIPIDSSPVDHNRISCVRSAQHVLSAPALLNISLNIQHITPPGSSNENSPPSLNWVAAFFEHWLWLIGFLFIAWSAGWIGKRFANEARPLEKDSLEIREAKQSALLGSRSELSPRLLSLVENKEAENVERENKNKKAGQRRHLPKFPAAFGLSILGAIAFLPPWSGDGFSWKNVKDNAWGVLGSEFSGGFAILAIAIIFFASRQINRLEEAENDFEIATKEARKVASSLESESLKRLKNDHADASVALGLAPIRPPWRIRRNTEISPLDENSFNEASKRVKDLLIAAYAISSTSTPAEISATTEALKQLAQGGWWGQPRRLEAFVDSLLENKSKPPSAELAAQLTKLKSGLALTNNLSIRARLNEFCSTKNDGAEQEAPT